MAKTRSGGAGAGDRKPSDSADQPAKAAAVMNRTTKIVSKRSTTKTAPSGVIRRRCTGRSSRPTGAAPFMIAAPPASSVRRLGLTADVVANPDLFNLQDPETLLRRARRPRAPRAPAAPVVQQQPTTQSAVPTAEPTQEEHAKHVEREEHHGDEEDQQEPQNEEPFTNSNDAIALVNPHDADREALEAAERWPDDREMVEQEAAECEAAQRKAAESEASIGNSDAVVPAQQTALRSAVQDLLNAPPMAAAIRDMTENISRRVKEDSDARIAQKVADIIHKGRKAAAEKVDEQQAREAAEREAQEAREMAEQEAAERKAREGREMAEREALEQEAAQREAREHAEQEAAEWKKVEREMIARATAEFAALEAEERAVAEREAAEAAEAAEALKKKKAEAKKLREEQEKAEKEKAEKVKAEREQAEREEAEREQARKVQAAKEEVERQKLANQQHGRPADYGMSDYWRKQRADSDAARADALKAQEEAEKVRLEKEEQARKEAAGGYKKAGKRPAKPTPTLANKKPRLEGDEDEDEGSHSVKDPNPTDKSSCVNYTQAELLAKFKFDRLNVTPAVEVGKPLQLDAMFQALAAITEAINDSRVAQQQSRLYSLFHPRSLVQPSFIDHQVVRKLHNAVIPIERRAMGKTHYSLIELVNTQPHRNIDDGRHFFDIRHYDCEENMSKAFETTFATKALVKSSIIKTGWAGRTDVYPDSILHYDGPMNVCERMHGQQWAVGIHVILNGWACALDLQHNANALLSKYGFYNRAAALINYALHGLVGSKMILDFFDCYEYTLPDTRPAEIRKDLTFKECYAFPTYASLDRQIGIYTGRIGARELERQQGIDHVAKPQPEPVEQPQQPFLPAVLRGSPHQAQPLPGLPSDVYADPNYNAPAEPMYDPDTISSQPARAIASFDQEGSREMRSEADIFADILGDLAETTPGFAAARPAATSATQQEKSGIVPEMSKEDRKILDDAKQGKVNDENDYAKGEDATVIQNRGFDKTTKVKPKKVRVVDNDPDAGEVADLPDEEGYDSARSSDDDFEDDDLDDEGKPKTPERKEPDPEMTPTPSPEPFWKRHNDAVEKAKAKAAAQPARETSVELEDPDDMDLFEEDEPEAAPEPPRLHLPGPPPPTPHFPVMPPPPPYVPALDVPTTTLTTPHGSVAHVEAPVMKVNTSGTFEAPETPEETPASSNESQDEEGRGEGGFRAP